LPASPQGEASLFGRAHLLTTLRRLYPPASGRALM